jgi:hypothetical protein
MEPNSSTPNVLDALRIQAAAVAAQQAALTEEELRLQQRRGTLEKQEAQLAAHLDGRRRRLLELQDEIKTGRAALEQARAAVREQTEAIARERQRLAELGKRLRQRWRNQWLQQEEKLKQREQELTAEREQVRRRAEALERERAAFEQGRLKLSGELELRRRESRDELEELALSQQRWEETINLEDAERQRREKALAAREAMAAQAERALAEQKRQWEQRQEGRRQEIDGLEKRVRHLRAQLPQAAVPAAPVAVAQRTDYPAEVPPALRRLAGDVADQRWRLLEQWRQLLEIHETWDRERAAAVADLETAALRLDEREQQLATHEGEVEARLEAARHHQETAAEQRQRLDAWQARLATREAAWEGERAALLGDVQAREESVAVLAEQLEQVRQRRHQRRCQEIKALRAARAGCEEVRGRYVALWQECRKRQDALAQVDRELAERRLALERYRVECLSRSPDPAAAEKRLEKLTNKAAARFAAAERGLAKQRDALAAEAARLEQRAQQLREWQDDLDQRGQDLARQEGSWETRQLEQTAEDRRRVRELRHLRLRHEHDERQLATFRDELERVARLLLDDAPDRTLSRAA